MVRTPLPPGKSQVDIGFLTNTDTNPHPLEKQLDPIVWPSVNVVGFNTHSDLKYKHDETLTIGLLSHHLKV